MSGDAGAIATLLNTIVSWFLEPDGYAQLTREKKLEQLHGALQVALDNHADDAANLIFRELRRLSQSGS